MALTQNRGFLSSFSLAFWSVYDKLMDTYAQTDKGTQRGLRACAGVVTWVGTHCAPSEEA